MIEAPLPAVVAVSDAINEPRYPSLKGIMGAKKKPQETLSLADLGVDADAVGEAGSRTEVYALGDPPPRGDTLQDRGRRLGAREGRRVPRREEGSLCRRSSSSSTTRARCRRTRSACSRKAASLGGEVAASSLGSGVAALAAQAGEHGARRVYVADDPALEAPLPQPRVDVLAALVRDGGYDTVLFGQSVLAADVAAGLAARLDAGLNWDLTDIASRTGGSSASGRRSATRSTSTSAGNRSRGSRSSAPARSTGRDGGGSAEVEDVDVELQDFSLAARDARAGARGARGARRSRTPT